MQDDVQLERRAGAVTDQGYARSLSSEADQVRIAARPGREALRADMQRLEQVRLAGAVWTDDEHEPRFQLELEPSVRAEICERDPGDDQPATTASLDDARVEGVRALPVRPAVPTDVVMQPFLNVKLSPLVV